MDLAPKEGAEAKASLYTVLLMEVRQESNPSLGEMKYTENTGILRFKQTSWENLGALDSFQGVLALIAALLPYGFRNGTNGYLCGKQIFSH